MDRSTYSAASGGMLQIKRLEVITNNLANANTVGFKRQVLVAKEQSFDETLASVVAKHDPYAAGDQKRASAVSQIDTKVDFTQGPIAKTGNPLNVALTQEGDFFEIITPEGPQYTRAGNFSLDGAGNLVTADGYTVSGDGGGINASGGIVSIAAGGQVLVDRVSVGQVKVVHFDDTSALVPVGGVRFKPSGPAPAPTNVEPKLAPESLEMANVSAVTSMVELITASRGFQAYTKSAQAVDQMNRDSIFEVGRGR